jgi:SAM-dependent methyltransferase
MSTSFDTSTLLHLDAIKAREKATWQSGDAGRLEPLTETAAHEFVDRLPLRPGQRLLDLACGTGNLSLAAARRGCLVSGIDINVHAIAQARARAEAEGLRIDFEEGDVEAFPCAGCQFEMVVSMFGIMYAPRPKLAVTELRRVTKPGGCAALANWTSAGFMGKMLTILAAHCPPPTGAHSPLLWGDEGVVRHRLRDGFSLVQCTPRQTMLRYEGSPAATVEFFRQFHGPTHFSFAALDTTGQAALRRDLEDLLRVHNLATDSQKTEIAADYLEVVATRG